MYKTARYPARQIRHPALRAARGVVPGFTCQNPPRYISRWAEKRFSYAPAHKADGAAPFPLKLNIPAQEPFCTVRTIQGGSHLLPEGAEHSLLPVTAYDVLHIPGSAKPKQRRRVTRLRCFGSTVEKRMVGSQFFRGATASSSAAGASASPAVPNSGQYRTPAGASSSPRVSKVLCPPGS